MDPEFQRLVDAAAEVG